MRVCCTPGCGTLVKTGVRHGRCPDCERKAAKARGTKAELGWGWEHRKHRAAIQQRIDAGEVVLCWRCGVQLHGRDWHDDHNDDRTGYRGPACVPCNLSLAGRASHRDR